MFHRHYNNYLFTKKNNKPWNCSPDDTRRLLLRTFVAQLVAVTKICPQPRQNAATTKRATNMASGDTDNDVSLIAGLEC